MMSTVLEMSPVSLTVSIAQCQTARFQTRKKQEFYVELPEVLFSGFYIEMFIISVYANLLKDFSVRCTEEHTNKVSSIDGSNSTNLTIGRYCVHVL